MALGRELGELKRNGENLTDLDKFSLIGVIAFSLFVIISCIFAFKRKEWSWVGITSFLVVTISVFVISNHYTDFIPIMLIYLIPMILVLLATFIFLLSKSVRNYFTVRIFHVISMFLLSYLVVFLATINPITDRKKVNSYYTSDVDNKVYLDSCLYSGILFTNHPNGSTAFEGEVKLGDKEGVWLYYHSNGNLETEVTYLKGKPNGKVITYFSNGTPREEHNFQNGKLHGQYKLWYDIDDLNVSGNYREDLKDGEWKKYEDGIVRIDKYKMDTLINTEYVEIEPSR